MDKLAALSGYQTITPAMVAEAGVVSLEADVFEMVRMVTAKMRLPPAKSCISCCGWARSPSPSPRP